jgi:tetratricopeptide (TPR) repeat protein
VLLACCSGLAVAQQDAQRAATHANKALDLMDRNQPESAIAEWDKAITLEPTNVAYKYERILCFVMAKNYDKALQELQPIYRDPVLKDRGYQLMGNVYDMKGDSSRSLRYYREGLDAYPASGRLHYELGAAAFIERRLQLAIDWWLRGTRAEPDFATNYYWLAKVYAESRDKIWAVLYGEAFLNLERTTDRTQEISKLLFDTWNGALRLGDTLDPINFCSDALLETPSPLGPSQMNFGTAFEFGVATAAEHLIPASGVLPALTLDQLCEVRARFIKGWVGQGKDTVYKNDLLDFLAFVSRSGWSGEYFHWLYAYGDRKAMNAYFRKNEHRYDTFLAWFGQNQLSFAKPLCLGLSCP